MTLGVAKSKAERKGSEPQGTSECSEPRGTIKPRENRKIFLDFGF